MRTRVELDIKTQRTGQVLLTNPCGEISLPFQQLMARGFREESIHVAIDFSAQEMRIVARYVPTDPDENQS